MIQGDTTSAVATPPATNHVHRGTKRAPRRNSASGTSSNDDRISSSDRASAASPHIAPSVAADAIDGLRRNQYVDQMTSATVRIAAGSDSSTPSCTQMFG